jgi:hypothetical protein
MGRLADSLLPQFEKGRIRARDRMRGVYRMERLISLAFHGL